MESWQSSLQQSLTEPAELARSFPLDAAALERVTERYPMRIPPYYLGLIREPGDPIWRQCVPDPRELDAAGLSADPLAEEAHSPCAALVHRYPDRALLLASGSCASYCRFCTRKRRVGCAGGGVSFGEIEAALGYLEQTPQIRDVLISGGDPLLMGDQLLGEILGRLRRISHVELIRIGSRVPVVLPERVTPGLCRVLAGHQPLFLNTHFNHPRELTAEAGEACRQLAEAGIPLGNQTVLLRGVNDDPETILALCRGLLRLRVRPYYLHQMDLTAGTAHFRTPLQTGLAVLEHLRGRITGLGIPQFVVDLPGGKGKIPLQPEYVRFQGDRVLVRTPGGEQIVYPDLNP